MNRKELITALAAKTGSTKADADRILGFLGHAGITNACPGGISWKYSEQEKIQDQNKKH